MRTDQKSYLIHYGTKGQKWGVRRYQNEDGTLTTAGKERYQKDVKKEKPESSTWKAKDAKHLDDAELNRRNNRLQRERNYKDLTTPQWKKDVKQTSKEWAKEAAKRIFIGTAVTLATVAMLKNYKKVGPFISRNSKKLISSIHNKRSLDSKKILKNAAKKYSDLFIDIGSKAPRSFAYKPGAINGFGIPKPWPIV